jgi:serine/threonine protein kinase
MHPPHQTQHLLGKGATSLVKEGTHRDTGYNYAIKILEKGKVLPTNNPKNTPRKNYNIHKKSLFLKPNSSSSPTSSSPSLLLSIKRQEKHLQHLQQEIQVLQTIQHHPNIVQLIEVYDEPKHTFLIFEKLRGGELYTRVVKKGYYKEAEAKPICQMLFQAVKHCHDHNIAHRDLKPENVLFTVRSTYDDVCRHG